MPLSLYRRLDFWVIRSVDAFSCVGAVGPDVAGVDDG